MSYSNSNGGTLTLPSPNSVHHVDVTTAVRSLRRSLSRSPSKFNIVRGKSQSPDASSSPKSPSPCRIIQRPMPPASAPQLSHQYSQSHLSTPFRPGVKLSLRSVKPKAASAKPTYRATRLSSKSPTRRVLSNTADSGNSTISSSPSGSDDSSGQENHLFANFPLTHSPTSRKSSERQQPRHSMHLDLTGASKNSLPRFSDSKPDPIPSTSFGPLKRGDARMNTDRVQVGSPVAKRRSLHGVSLFSTNDSTVFDTQSPLPEGFKIHEDQNREDKLDTDPSLLRDDPASPTPAEMSRRSDSLRKSTLQQRQGDRSSWGRRQGEKHLAQMGAEVSTPNPRSRPRVSLDQFVQPVLPRDSPFSARDPLPNPSLHMLDRPSHTPQPHPLSRSLTTSSSNSSLADESPCLVPVHFERPKHSFAKSMPVGARPPLDHGNRNTATPAYKSARPLQDAFKSTGLISKVNRNPEQEPTYRGVKQVMPDTPCKKPIYPSNTYPTSSGGGKTRQRHSFGSPSSPFAPGRKENIVIGDSDKRASLFKPFQPGHPRKASIFSFDSDIDSPESPDNIEFPPTPTKSVLFRSLGNSKSVGETNFTRSLPVPLTVAGFRDARPMPEPMCKSTPLKKSSTDTGVADRTHFEAAETTAVLEGDLSLPLSEPVLSFHKSRARRGSHTTPERLELHFTTPTLSSQKKVEFAKTTFVITASPLAPMEKLGAASPKTPRENTNLIPLDPSSLSISNHDASKIATFGSSFPPATPTTRQGDHFGFADRRMSITPVNDHGPNDVDMVLSTRFDEVELIGKGEFSQVFKVKDLGEQHPAAALSGTPGTPPTPSKARIFAVKRTRLPFFGAKDRESKLREVNILQALCGRPHVLQYVDSWEKQYHLYIQTEYCEEGSLSDFLGTVGSAGRLDDFRIWKILVEACMGLQSIHDAGLIHLDIKPDNILIDYEGTLKIGDFGMATKWPAARGIEGEGDRRYIAPEILQGRYDMPADVFALGLIMFEIASNVWLPDNGPHWLALREGNFAGFPTGPLTGSESDALVRDATGMPVVGDVDITSGVSPLPRDEHDPAGDNSQDFPFNFSTTSTHDASNLFAVPKRGDPRHPPKFMVEAEHPDSLDQIVQWMLAPKPDDRPTAEQVLDFESAKWVITHRRAGATVFEGNWGSQGNGQVDMEMMDV